MAGGAERAAEERQLSISSERSVALGGRRVPVVVAGAIALLAAGRHRLLRRTVEPVGAAVRHGRALLLGPDLSNPYLHSNWTDQIAYPYSPAFLQVLEPIRLLPWQLFMAVWAAILMAAMVYLTGPRLILLGLAFFGLMEIWGGNIELLIAVAIVLGFRWPAAWAFVLLTKVTPGVGLLWFAVRREWCSLAIALAATVAVVAVSAAIAPNAWLAWRDVLVSNAGKNGTWAAVPIPFAVRLPAGVLLVVWGARKNRRWTVPVAAMLALPALWYGGLSIMLATLPLLGARTWGDVRRTLGDGWSELLGEIGRLPRPFGRGPAPIA